VLDLSQFESGAGGSYAPLRDQTSGLKAMVSISS
jgi:hypothetical protein